MTRRLDPHVGWTETRKRGSYLEVVINEMDPAVHPRLDLWWFNLGPDFFFFVVFVLLPEIFGTLLTFGGGVFIIVV